MVATVIFALGSGVLDAINDRYEENWEQIRDEATNLDPDYCTYKTDAPRDGYEPSDGSTWQSQVRKTQVGPEVGPFSAFYSMLYSHRNAWVNLQYFGPI